MDLRPVEGAVISAPLKWSEVREGLDPKAFNIETIFRRVDKFGDLWKGVLGKGIDMEKALNNLSRLYAK